jgi:hypothetical protein
VVAVSFGVTLEGVEVVVKLPESSAAPATLVQASDGDLTLSGCTVSATGGRRGGVTVARLQSGPDGGRRCLLRRCFARGPALTLLAAESPGAELLIDGCLAAGGEASLLQVAAGGAKPINLRVVRSTLIGWKTLLEVRGDARPALNWLGWDSLLCRSSEQAGGDLAALPSGSSTSAMTWRAVNCLYAGWHNLLSGPPTLDVDRLGDWQRLWKRSEGDVARRVGWPVRPYVDPEDRPAKAFQADDSVPFAASVDPLQPLGCDLAALPPARDNWQTLAYERTLTRVPEPPSDARPDAPAVEADPYEGGDLNLDRVKDLGAFLAAKRLGKRVVLRLSGAGEKTTSPIRVKNADLTLYFEPPRDDKAPPLVLTHGDRASEALIDVENGKLEVIGGEFRCYDSTRAEAPAWLIQVRGGDLQLSRCRLYGPQQTVPEGYQGLVRWQGCGDAAENKVQKLAIADSVLLSSRACVQVEGIGARLLLRQSVLVAGTDALALELGAAYQGRAGWQGVVEHCTLAARRSAVHCGPAEYAGASEEPALLQTRDCAFVNPFKDKDAKMRPVHPGLLTADPTSLGRGALLWQSEGDLYDNRLYFRAAAAPPEQPQGHAFWVRLLGTPGLRRPQPFDLGRANVFDDDRWGQQLERLALPPQVGTGDKRPGADVKKLVKKAG